LEDSKYDHVNTLKANATPVEEPIEECLQCCPCHKKQAFNGNRDKVLDEFEELLPDVQPARVRHRFSRPLTYTSGERRFAEVFLIIGQPEETPGNSPMRVSQAMKEQWQPELRDYVANHCRKAKNKTGDETFLSAQRLIP
jgi:hypothetical protein